jgi:hypothetical protein
VSEYQYYEFQAIDRPLSERDMAALRRLSSRATITRTRFTNEYNYGDFRGDPRKLVEKHFDAFLYFANWGTREISLRVPRGALDLATAKRYASGHAASARRKGDYVILELASEREGGDYHELDEGVLDEIAPIRADLAGGDLRALYLAWLLNVQQEGVGLDAEEPPCPGGLGQLSAPLEALADFLQLEPQLIAAAAERSPKLPPPPSKAAVASAIAAWPERRKNALLARLTTEDPALVRSEVLQHLRSAQPTAPVGTEKPRLAGEILEAAGFVVHE